jgi:nucleotide-binding universal stress UspA family protein
MITISKILVPTDLSSYSVPGIGYATSLAKLHDAEMLVLHAMPYAAIKEIFGPGYASQGLIEPAGAPIGGRHADVEGILETKKQIVLNFLEQKVAPELLHAVKIRQIIRLGKVVQEIIATAKEEQSDLIVITSHASPFRRLFHATFTERVIREAPCPVLSIQPSAQIRTGEHERLTASLIDRWAA